MGRKFDSLIGRNFKAPKLKALLNLAICRLTVLKNQRQARCSLARSDIVELLNLGHHERALVRVEQVIKEQNMLDVFAMIEGYCHLLEERINQIEEERECPEELKEAVSSMLYAATRCGDFPELQEMRSIFTSQFGKEFAARAMELRNNCGVNPKIIQKLSTRQPSLENRLKVLKEIALENNIVLHLEGASSITAEEKLEAEQKQYQPKPESSAIPDGSEAGDDLHNLNGIGNMEGLSDSINPTRKYKDVADAAEAAFKSAAYAAAAARAAVELSKSSSHNPDGQNTSRAVERQVTSDHADHIKSNIETDDDDNLTTIEDQNVRMGFEKVHPLEDYHSGSEDEVIHVEKRVEEDSEDEAIHVEKGVEESEKSKIAILGPNLISDEDVSEVTPMSLDEEVEAKPIQEGIKFDASDNETENEQCEQPLSTIHEPGLDTKPIKEDLCSKKLNSNVDDKDLYKKDDAEADKSQKKSRSRHLAGLKARLRAWKS